MEECGKPKSGGFAPTPEMEAALAKVIEQFGDVESEEYDADDFLDRLADFENDYMPDNIRREYVKARKSAPSKDLLDWEKWVYKDTPWSGEYGGDEPSSGDEQSSGAEQSDVIKNVISAIKKDKFL